MAQGSAEAHADYKTKNGDKSSEATFGAEGQQALSDLMKSFQNPSNTAVVNNRNVLDALQNRQVATVDTNARMEAIRKASDAQTQKDIAEGRSKFYNRPTGRQDINLADTVSRNAAARDSKLMEVASAGDTYNAQAQNARTEAERQQAMAVSPEQTQQAQQNQQLMQALQILRGEHQTSKENELGVGASAAGKFGLACWIARAVYGEDNPKWLLFRDWLLFKAPSWFFNFYVNYGEEIADGINRIPFVKPFIRFWMNTRIKALNV